MAIQEVTDTYPGLDPEHSAYLRDRAVLPALAVERGYQLVRQGHKKGGGEFAAAWGFPRKAAGLLFPLHGILDDDPKASVQLRLSRDVQHLFLDKDGKPKKFLTPQGQRNVLATAPRTRARLSEPRQGLIIAEGVTRVDALASYNIPAVGLVGIWNWRGLTVLPDFEALAVKGNRIIIAPDGDVRTNRKVLNAVKRLLKFLKAKGADSVQVLAVPNGQGLDDWIAANDFESAETLMHALREFLIDDFLKSRIQPAMKPRPVPVPATPGDAPAASTTSPSGGGDIKLNPHYEILGLVGDAVAVRIEPAGRVLQQSRESLSSPATLISLAPQTFWHKMTESQQLGGATARDLGDKILRAADQLGQKDLTLITGRGAARLTDGTVVFHLGDRLLVAGRELGLNEQLGERIWLAEPRIELGAAASVHDMRVMASAVLSYRWASEDDGKQMLGWMVTGLIGGALDWRPHIYFSARATIGKSWFLKRVLSKFMGPLMPRIADATLAGLYRLTASSSLPIAVDEAEPSANWVEGLLGMLRISAGGEGLRVRADGATGGYLTQEPRFSAILSSTSVPELSRADASRLTMINLGKPVDDWDAVRTGIESAMEKADAARYRIIRRAPEIVALADKVALEFQSQGMDSRDARASAALTAGWHEWGLDTDDLYSRSDSAQADAEQPEAVKCLQDILAVRDRVSGVRDKTLLAVLVAGLHDFEMADLYGVRILKPEEVLAIAPGHARLKVELSHTKWRGTDLKRLLLQIEGSSYIESNQRFGDRRLRYVQIPAEVLDSYGISLRAETNPTPDTPPASMPYPAPEQRGF